jgi:hypothetical protein
VADKATSAGKTAAKAGLEAKHSNRSTAKELGKKAWESGVKEPGRAAGEKIEGVAQAGDRVMTNREERLTRRVSNAKEDVKEFNEQAKRDSFGFGEYGDEDAANEDFEQPTADDVDFGDTWAGGEEGVRPTEGVGEDHNPESDRPDDDSDVGYADDDAWAGGPEGNRFRSGEYGDPDGSPRPEDSTDPADQPPSSGSTTSASPTPRRMTGQAESDNAEVFESESDPEDAAGRQDVAGDTDPSGGIFDLLPDEDGDTGSEQD